MNIILHCPSHAAPVPALTRRVPLALTPLLGATVIEHALAALAAEGVRRIRVAATQSLAEIRAVVGRGEAWGVDIEVTTPTASGNGPPPDRVVALEHLPQLPHLPLWRSYRDWYGVHQELLPLAARQQLAMREIAPGVFASRRSQLSADARLEGPCWIGAGVFIGRRARVGPGTVIEDGCYVDEGAEITGSIIGPRTFVGAYVEVRDSFAWGDELLQLDTGSLTRVPDPFLLAECQVRRRSIAHFLARLASRTRAPWSGPEYRSHAASEAPACLN